MDSASDSHAAVPVRYLLTSRLSSEGQVAITLKLYRGHRVALTRAVAVVDRDQSADVMRKCRQHLGKLGLEGVSGGPARPPAAGGLPPASRLFQHRS